MTETNVPFIALALAGLLSTLIIYMARTRGHHAHQGGIVLDASTHTTGIHVHLHV